MQVRLVDSLWNHVFFTLSLLLLLTLFLCGIHKRVVAPSMYQTLPNPNPISPGSRFLCRIASRCRAALSDFNMSCDDVDLFNSKCRLSSSSMGDLQSGKLILKPRPSSP